MAVSETISDLKNFKQTFLIQNVTFNKFFYKIFYSGKPTLIKQINNKHKNKNDLCIV